MLSIIVIAKNEENRIKTCLESVKWADEIILVDNNSTDKTVEIARSYTDNILKVDEFDFAEIRNRAMERSKGDWVLYVDADERVLEPLKTEILETISTTDKSAYAVRRINIIFGKKVNYGPYKNDWVIRLFKRSDFEGWIGKVHEYGKFKGDLGYFKKPMLHLTHRDLDSILLKKTFEWSKIDAKLRFDKHHPKMSGWRFIRIFVTETFNQGLKRGGFFGGTVGVMDSMLSVFSMFLTYVRLWEMQQPQLLNKVYDEIDKKLIEEDFKYS